MKNKTSLSLLPLCFSLSVVASVYGLPSGIWALGDSHVCWSTAGFPVIVVWSSQASLGLQATTSTLIMFPVCACSGGTCYPAMTVCSAPLLYPRATVSALSLLSVVPELWLRTACQQHTLCPCHLSPITPAAATCSRYPANISPTAFSVGHAPSGEEGFFSNQWLLLDSDTTKQWHLGNIMSSVLEMV